MVGAFILLVSMERLRHLPSMLVREDGEFYLNVSLYEEVQTFTLYFTMERARHLSVC